MKIFVPFLLFCLVWNARPLYAVEVAPRISDREIIEQLSQLKEGQRQLERQMDHRFDAVDQRFDAMQAQIDQRFKSIDQRFDDLNGFMRWGFGVIFAGIFTLIGFVLWDRRTTLAPAVRTMQELQAREDRFERIIEELAKKNPDVAKAVHNTGGPFRTM